MPLARKSQTKVINKERNFCIRPFSYMPRGMFTLSMLEEANEEPKLLHGRMHRTNIVFDVNDSPNILPCKLESRVNISVCNLQRVLRQFRYDQKSMRV